MEKIVSQAIAKLPGPPPKNSQWSDYRQVPSLTKYRAVHDKPL
jgi:hypothetical protein